MSATQINTYPDPLLAAGLSSYRDKARYHRMTLARRAEVDCGRIVRLCDFTQNALARGAVELSEQEVKQHHPDNHFGWWFPDDSYTYAEKCGLEGGHFITFCLHM